MTSPIRDSRQRNRVKVEKVEVITIDSDEDKADVNDNIFATMNGYHSRTKNSREKSPSSNDNQLPNRTPVQKRTENLSHQNVEFSGENGRKLYRPFGFPEKYRPSPNQLKWTDPTPFDDFDEGVDRMVSAFEDELSETEPTSPMVRSVGKASKRPRILSDESDSSDSDEGLMAHIMKMRRISPSDSKEPNPSSFPVTAIPNDLLKPCIVELQALPEEIIRESLKNSPLARTGSPGKYDREARFLAADAVKALSDSAAKKPASASAKDFGRTGDERKLAELMKRRERLEKKLETGQRNTSVVRNIFDETGSDNVAGPSGKMSKATLGSGAKEALKGQDALNLISLSPRDQRLEQSIKKQMPVPSIKQKTQTSNEASNLSLPVSQRPAVRDEDKPLRKQSSDTEMASHAHLSASSSSIIGPQLKSTPITTAEETIKKVSPPFFAPVQHMRLEEPVSSGDGTERSGSNAAALEGGSRRIAQLSADQAVQRVLSRPALGGPSGVRERAAGISDAIRKGRAQLQTRLAQNTQLVAAKTPSIAAQADAAASVKRMKIPKLSPSKHKGTVKYVSPLDQGQLDKAASIVASVSKKSHPPSPKKSPYVKSLLKRIQKKGNSYQFPVVVPATIPVLAPAPTKSILKTSLAPAESVEGPRLVIDCGPKKRVTFTEEPQIRYFECVKPRRNPASDFGTSVPNLVQQQMQENATLGIGDEIVSAILKWNPVWLQEAKHMLDTTATLVLPPIAPDWPLLNVQRLYNSVDSYFNTYKALLLHETWQKLFQEYLTELWEKRDTLECRVVNVVTVANVFKDFSVVALVDKDKVSEIRENVLLTFRLADRKTNDQDEEHRPEPSFLGLITNTSWITYRRLDEVTPELRKCAKVTEENVKQFCQMKMTIRAKWKTNMPSYEIGPMVVEIMSDLSPIVRLVTALSNVQHNPLGQMIINPSTIGPFPSPAEYGKLKIGDNPTAQYSVQQLAVISGCMHTLVNKEQPSMRLIVGPTESGKTHTIVGLIEEIQLIKLQQIQEEIDAGFSQPPKHRGVVLVLASSADAIDELSRRILGLNRRYPSTVPGGRFLKFIRLGDQKTVAESVSRYCMGTLVDNNMRQEETEAATTVDENRSQVTERIAHLQGQLYSFLESQLSLEDQLVQQQIQAEIKQLERLLAHNGKGRKHHTTKVTPPEPGTAIFLRDYLKKVDKQKRRLIEHADVIAATLNGNGEDLDLVKHMQWEGVISVTCAIVDDASRAPELETLIAAFPPIRKLFLFGREDEEVPGRTLSTVAFEHGFGNSLFARILSSFDSSNAPVFRLSNSNS